MESKQEQEQEKITMLRTVIKQLIDEEKERCKDVLGSDDVDKEFDHHRLLSKLLSQVETLEIEIEKERTRTEVEPSEVAVIEHQPEKKKEVESSRNEEEEGRRREEEIIKELRKIKRQNLITHCLLSAMFVLTVAWQLSEVSLILKVKESINNPIRSIGRMFTGILKKPPPALVQVEDDNNKPKQGQSAVIQTSVPGIIVPKLPLVDLPSLDFDFDRD